MHRPARAENLRCKYMQRPPRAGWILGQSRHREYVCKHLTRQYLCWKIGPVKTCLGQSRHAKASQDMFGPVKTCLSQSRHACKHLTRQHLCWKIGPVKTCLGQSRHVGASQDMFGPVKTCFTQSRHVCKHLTRQYLCWKIDVQMYGS